MKTLWLGTVLIAMGSMSAAGQQPPAPRCDDVPGFQRLDFWVGDWVVQVDGREVGTNRIEKILDGCAVMEHWSATGGGDGKSLFYYHPVTDTWKQVWVTGQATGVGGLKEKTLIEQFDDGGVRFQGHIPLPDGGEYLDRTTLTPLSAGRVRQVIEVSEDGERWRVTFDAIYVKASTVGSSAAR